MRVRLKKILCATDFSPYSNHVVPYGLALARKYEAKLLVCHAVDFSAAALYDMGAYAYRETKEKLLREAAAQVRKLMEGHGVKWEPLVIEGIPSVEIPRVAAEEAVDLVVLASHGRSGMKRMLLGSVTERLLQTLPCPVLAVRAPEHEFVGPKGENLRLKRILVGCDFSEGSGLALSYALNLAQEFEAEVHIIHVLEPSFHEHLTSVPSALAEELRQAVSEVVERKLAEEVPPSASTWCEVKTSLLVGRPDEELVKYATKHEIDLIAVGVHGRGLLDDLLVGSTTDRVLRQMPCPLLAVRKLPGA
jgi:nucleotide-binding universal stress UspA family protein